MADVIQDFLIAIGVKTDDASLKKASASMASLEEGLIAAGEAAAGMAAAFATAALAVGVGVTKMAGDLETLYFASRRIGASVEAIKSFGYAFENMGGSAQGAQAALEAMSKALATNPAMENFLSSLGVKTRGTQGGLRDTKDLLTDFGKVMATKPMWMAAQYASLFGIDYKTLQILRSDLSKDEKRYDDWVKRSGIDFDKAAQSSHEFGQAMRGLQAQLEMIGGRAGARVIEGIVSVLERIQSWINSNQGELTKLGNDFDDLTTSVGALLDTLLHLGGVDWGKGLLGVLDHLVKELSFTLKAINALLHGDLKGAASFEAQALENDPAIIIVKKAIGAVAGAPVGAAAAATYQGAKSFFEGQGWTPEQAAGIAAGLGAESRFNSSAKNPTSSAYGVGQWLTARQRDFAKWAGHDIHGSSLAEQLGFVNWELRNSRRGAGAAIGNSQNSQSALLAFLQMYEAPGPGLAGDLGRARVYLGGGRGSRSASITQNNHFNVTGPDPHTTANRVAAAQGRVNADLVRNSAPKVV